MLNPAQTAMIKAMPAPQLSNITGSCTNTPLTFASPAAQSVWQNRYGLPLRLWAISHVGARAGTTEGAQCNDMMLATQLWQSAIGSPVTGLLSERDANEFVRYVDGNNLQYAQTRQTNGMSQEDRAVDMFLPLAQQGDAKAQFRVASVYEQQGKLDEAQMWYQRATEQGSVAAKNALNHLQNNSEPLENNNTNNNSANYNLIADLEKVVYELEHQNPSLVALGMGGTSAASKMGLVAIGGMGIKNSNVSDGLKLVKNIIECASDDVMGAKLDKNLLRYALDILKNEDSGIIDDQKINAAEKMFKQKKKSICPKQ